MKSENLIHVRVDYEGARQSKRDILFTEISLIRMAKIIQEYKNIRDRDFHLQDQLEKQLKEFKSDIKAMQHHFPNVKLPKFIEEELEGPKEHHENKDGAKHEQKHTEKEIESQKMKAREIIRIKEDPLEAQLREIQDKLSQLG